MQVEKHIEALQEVYETIEESLNDPKGLLGHQRRIASMASLGAQQLIEMYFHRLNIIKPGTQVKHEWLKSEEQNLRHRLSPILTRNIAEIPNIQAILDLANRIECDRNDILYGAPLKEDKKLKEKIDNFLELKKVTTEEKEIMPKI